MAHHTTPDTSLSRRQMLGAVAAAAAPILGTGRAAASQARPPAAPVGPLGADVLPRGIRSRFVENNNGIRFHVLEAGYESTGRPGVLMVHGFPELAYSWRKVMPAIAAEGYHVFAPDLRGYGRSGGTDVGFDDDLSPFRTLNSVRDMLGLVSAFGYRSVAAVVGHDFGSPVAAWCAVVRPDVFQRVVMMSAPFGGPPALPFNTADQAAPAAAGRGDDIYDALAKLSPPRKHYQRYYSAREANANMHHAPQGVHDFLRAYYHMKSADWKQNQPYALAGRTAAEWAKMPRYYIMDLDKGMAESVAPEMPTAADIAACKWLPDADLRVYSGEYGRTGFQGGLQSYRVGSSGRFNSELQLFSGRTIDQPSMFIGGKADWGVFQNPGSFETMQKRACTQMTGAHLVEGAGHWVQQEQPEAVSKLLIDFLRQTKTRV